MIMILYEYKVFLGVLSADTVTRVTAIHCKGIIHQHDKGSVPYSLNN